MPTFGNGLLPGKVGCFPEEKGMPSSGEVDCLPWKWMPAFGSGLFPRGVGCFPGGKGDIMAAKGCPPPGE